MKHCLKGVGDMKGHFQIKARLRDRVKFRALNLNEALPRELGRFDVIFLRNVLIYFDREAKKRIVYRLLEFLSSGGYLEVGHSESLHGLGLSLQTVQPSVYRKH